jgi:hypothetical protein
MQNKVISVRSSWQGKHWAVQIDRLKKKSTPLRISPSRRFTTVLPYQKTYYITTTIISPSYEITGSSSQSRSNLKQKQPLREHRFRSAQFITLPVDRSTFNCLTWRVLVSSVLSESWWMRSCYRSEDTEEVAAVYPALLIPDLGSVPRVSRVTRISFNFRRIGGGKRGR